MKWALALAVAACGTKPEPVASDPPLEGTGYPPEVARWAVRDELTPWTGAYVARFYRPVSRRTVTLAVDIQGGGAKGFDGSGELPLAMAILAPCIARFTPITLAERDPDAPISGVTFAFAQGRLIASSGYVGRRRGDAAIVCGLDVLTLDEQGRCTRWDPETWVGTPATCAWRSPDRLAFETQGVTLELRAEGDVLLSELARTRGDAFARQPSYEAAKRALSR